MPNEANQDWANARGIATEPNIDHFVESVGGKRVDGLFPGATFENADYFFPKQSVVVELKILETEFGETKPFLEKEREVIAEMAEKFSPGEFLPKLQPGARSFYVRRKMEIYRGPLSRIAKKANRQIRETKKVLGRDDIRGVLWLVNDNFRDVSADVVFGLMCRILNGDNSHIRAFVYATNHYVEIPGNEFANLLWRPAYAEPDADDLPNFVNWLGSEWGDFQEAETGPFDSRTKGLNISIAGARPIR